MSVHSLKESIEATLDSAASQPSVTAVSSQTNDSGPDHVLKDVINSNGPDSTINDVEKHDVPPQSPVSQQSSNFQYGHPGYYPFQNNNSQPPSSPAGANLASAGYIQDLFMKQQQAGVGNIFNARQQYANSLQGPPLSPLNVMQGSGEDGPNLSMGTIPPASPLFPGAAAFGSNPVPSAEQQEVSRMNGTIMGASPTSPSIYPLSPLYGGMYQIPGSIPNSPEPRSWSDRNMISQPQMYPHSPQVMPVHYPGNGQNRRTPSFDELLPPSALEDNGSNAYVTTNSVGTGNPFSQGQPWGLYSPNPADPYAASQNSPQQIPMHPHQSAPSGHNNGTRLPIRQPPSGPYYPAATPGPPIQTTHHNKGPEGANLFIFHIPNHFTNLDMWHLFCHYGNLLSVRIMVEKDTGRSRGFGFVSYDSPAAAANAIKELNGFVIGNKRLKVQHKQIRSSESNPAHHEQIHSPPLIPQSHVALPPTGQPNNQAPQTLMNPGWLGESDPKETQPEMESRAIESAVSGESKPGRSRTEAASSLNNLNSIRDALPEGSTQ